MSGGRDTGERGQVLRLTWDLGHRRPWTAACLVPDLEPASEGRIKHFQAQGGGALQTYFLPCFRAGPQRG